MSGWVEQRVFPGAGTWLQPGPPDLSGWAQPDRSRPAIADLPSSAGIVIVIGTVRDEAVPLDRSLRVWARQILPDWLRDRAEAWVLDDGSRDDPASVVARWRGPCAEAGIRLRYAQVREPGDAAERSCTLVHNAAIAAVTTPLVMVQWWDRIPGSHHHLASLVAPHLHRAGIVTSAIARHVGGSSSCDEMTPDQLAAVLGTVDWESDPGNLAVVAGAIGGHCVPGQATESPGLVAPVVELRALGAYDERYVTRAGYANVELWRRLLQVGLVALFPPPARGQNFHQSHAANRAKDRGWLHDPVVVRNRGVEWGRAATLRWAW